MNDICTNNHGGNAESVAASRTTNRLRDRNRIIVHLASVPDATCDEVEVALEMNHQTCSARFSELKAAGLIEPTTRRKTRTGAMAMAWRRKE